MEGFRQIDELAQLQRRAYPGWMVLKLPLTSHLRDLKPRGARLCCEAALSAESLDAFLDASSRPRSRIRAGAARLAAARVAKPA